MDYSGNVVWWPLNLFIDKKQIKINLTIDICLAQS